MNTVYFSLGSNLGERRENLKRAIELLNHSNIEIDKVSSLYETEPVGLKNQDNFYNICVQASTNLIPEQLLNTVKSIEKEMGRVKTAEKGPRIIDIDILFYSNIIFKDNNLKIPHSEIAARKFVLVPLREIAPEYIHPERNKPVEELINDRVFKEKVELIGEL